MRAFHLARRLSRKSPEGRHAWSFGLRVGYWPCLLAPYVAVDFGKHRLEAWYGLPSVREGGA